MEGCIVRNVAKVERIDGDHRECMTILPPDSLLERGANRYDSRSMVGRCVRTFRTGMAWRRLFEGRGALRIARMTLEAVGELIELSVGVRRTNAR